VRLNNDGANPLWGVGAMYKRILAPLDGSVLAEQALPHAVAQAERFGAELILLRVVEPIAPMDALVPRESR
jgi:nucleotide-binding universal stress UspA family protein